MYFDWSRSIRYFCFPLAKTTFELNCSAIETACWSVMHVCFTHCVVRARPGNIPKREATTHNVNFFRELFQVVNIIDTKSLRFVSRMTKIRFLVLIQTSNWLQRYKHVILKYLSMDSGLRQRCKLQAKSGFRCVQTSASRFSFTNETFLVGPLLPSTRMPLLMLSAVACTSRWGSCRCL